MYMQHVGWYPGTHVYRYNGNWYMKQCGEVCRYIVQIFTDTMVTIASNMWTGMQPQVIYKYNGNWYIKCGPVMVVEMFTDIIDR